MYNKSPLWKITRDRMQKLHPIFHFMQVFLLCGVTALLFLSILISAVLNPLLKEQGMAAARNAFQRADTDMMMAQKTAQYLGVQLLLDKSCSHLLNSSDPKQDYAAMTTGINQLRLLNSTNSNIHSLYIINNRAGLIFSSNQSFTDVHGSSFYDKSILEWVQQPEHARTLAKRTGIPDLLSFKEAQDVYTFVVPNRYVNDYLESCVVVNLSLKSLEAQFSSYYEFQNDTYLRVSDEQDTLIEICTIDSPDTDKLLKWSQNTIQNHVTDDSKRFDGTTYTLINHTAPSTELILTLVQPQSVVLASMARIQNTFIRIMVTSILLELLLSLLGSKYIRKIFSTVEQERDDLAQSLLTTLDLLREKFWRGYLTGSIRSDNPNFPNLVKKHRISDASFGSLCVLKINVSGNETNTLSSRESTLIRQTFLDSFAELKPLYLFQQRNLFTFLLRVPDASGIALLPYIPEAFTKQIPGRFHLIGNQKVVEMKDYPDIWKDILFSAKASFFYPPNTYLDSGKISAEHSDTSNCSNLAIVQQIACAIVDSNLPSAQNLFLQFENTLQHKTYDCYYNHIVWLAMTITNSAASSWLRISKENEPNVLFQNFAEEISVCINRQQVVERFICLLKQLVTIAADSVKVTAASKKAESVKNYIEKNYADLTLNINTMAENLSLSPDYLRKIFKSVYGQSLSDYLSQIRLQAAADKLENTDDSLKEIANTCGFSSVNYFCTCFKKNHGLTPTQYRSSHREGL